MGLLCVWKDFSVWIGLRWVNRANCVFPSVYQIGLLLLFGFLKWSIFQSHIVLCWCVNAQVFIFFSARLFIPAKREEKEREGGIWAWKEHTCSLLRDPKNIQSVYSHAHTHVLSGTSRHLSTPCALELFFIFRSTICFPSWMNINYSNNSALHCKSFVSLWILTLASLNTLHLSRTGLDHVLPQNQK